MVFIPPYVVETHLDFETHDVDYFTIIPLTHQFSMTPLSADGMALNVQ